MSAARSGQLRDLLLRHSQPAIAGTIVCGAVIAAGSGQGHTIGTLAVAILVSSCVYWIAHIYIDSLAIVARGQERLPDALRHAAAHTWFLAGVSLIPLAVLLLAAALGAEVRTAATAALLATAGLLATYGAMAGRRGGLGLIGTTTSALGGAGLGLLLIAVKGLH